MDDTNNIERLGFRLLSIRGAIVCSDTVLGIQGATKKLYTEIAKQNGLDSENCQVSAVFLSTTNDLRACFAASGLRGVCDAALFSSVEPDVKGALRRCIRMLVQANTSDNKLPKHVYLGGAKVLRPDISKFVVCLDGPAGAGKSTLAKLIARELGVVHLDTGALYRAVAIKLLTRDCYQDKVLADSSVVCGILEDTKVDVVFGDGMPSKVILDGQDVTEQIRQYEISSITSSIAGRAEIRQFVKGLVETIASRQSCIMDGRDIGTVVMPNAEFKFFVTADLQNRAERRHEEQRNKGHIVQLQDILTDIDTRDKRDSGRDIAPLKKAQDAKLIDTTGKSVEQSLKEILGHIYSQLG